MNDSAEVRKLDSYLVLLIFIAVVLFFFKLIRLDYFSMWMDEGFYYLSSQAVREFGYPLYPSGHVLYKSIFFSYLLAAYSFLAGHSSHALRLFSLLLHTLTPVLVYLSLRRIVRREVIFLAGMFVLFSLWHIEYSRTALYFTLLGLLVTLGWIYFFRARILEGKAVYPLFWLAGLLTHQLAMALAFSFAALFCLRPKRFWSRGNMLSLLFWVPVFILAQLQEVLLWRVGQVYSTQEVSGPADMAAYFFQGFSLQYFKILWRSFPVLFPFFVLASALFLALVLLRRLKGKLPDREESMIVFLIVVLFLTILFLGFMKTHPMPRYLFPYSIPFFLVCAYLLFRPLQAILGRFFRKSWPGVVLSLLLVFLLVGDIKPSAVSEVVFRDHQTPIRNDIITTSGRYFHYDHRSTGLYVRDHLRQDDLVIAMHMIFQYLYAGRVDYWLFSGGTGTWDAWELVDGEWREFYLGVPWINNREKLEAVINESLASGRRVWLITSFSAIRDDHINRSLQEFLAENENRTAWLGRDGLSRALLFDGGEPPSPAMYRAPWADFYLPGREPEDTVEVKNSYRSSFVHLPAGLWRFDFSFTESEQREVLVKWLNLRRPGKWKYSQVKDGRLRFYLKVEQPDWYFFELHPRREAVRFKELRGFQLQPALAEPGRIP